MKIEIFEQNARFEIFKDVYSYKEEGGRRLCSHSEIFSRKNPQKFFDNIKLTSSKNIHTPKNM